MVDFPGYATNSVIPHCLELHGQKEKAFLVPQSLLLIPTLLLLQEGLGESFCSAAVRRHRRKRRQTKCTESLPPCTTLRGEWRGLQASLAFLKVLVGCGHGWNLPTNMGRQQGENWAKAGLSEGRAGRLRSPGEARAVGHLYCKRLVQRIWVRERCVTSLELI